MSYPPPSHIETCAACNGDGEVMGTVMRVYCTACNGVGFIDPDDTPTKPLDIRLGDEIRRLNILLAQAQRPAPQAAAPYPTNNRGPGGSCFTGD